MGDSKTTIKSRAGQAEGSVEQRAVFASLPPHMRKGIPPPIAQILLSIYCVD